MGIAVIIGESKAHRLFEEGVFPRCPLIHAHSAALIDCPSAAVILGASPAPELRSAAALIANADAPDSLTALGGRSIPIITCGRGSRNTVSITSITEERLTLSLNRSLQTLGGICEPLEQTYPLLADIPLYDYMAAFAASIIIHN